MRPFNLGATIIASRDVTITIRANDAFSVVLNKYNQAVDSAAKNTSSLGKASDGSASNFDRLSKAVTGFVTIGLAVKIGQIGLELNQLGREVNATRTVFEQLAGGSAAASDLLDRMADATGNVVDNMTLMRGASQLMNLGLTQSADQTVKLVDMIIALKKPTDDATSAVDNFSLMLSNASYLRLDSFGLSAGRVRDRVAELKEEFPDMAREARFTMATMEEMEKKMVKLGDATKVAETATGRMETTFENFKQQFGSNLNQGVEGGLGIIEIMLGIHPAQQAILKAKADAAAIALAEDLNHSLISAMSGAGFGMDAGFITEFVKTSLEMAATDPSLMGDVDNFMSAVFRQMGATVGDTGPFRQILQDTMDIHLFNQEDRDNAAEMAAEQQRILDIEAQRVENARMVLSFTDQMADLNERNSRAAIEQYNAEQRIAGIRAQMMGQMGESGQAAFGAAFSMNGEMHGDTGVPQYLTQGQAAAVAEQADAVATLVDQMKALNEETEGTFTEEEIENAESYSDRLGDMADNAQAAADAFENMSLDELLGRDSGGRLGEELDVVLEKMKALGAEAHQLQNAGDAFDLASGRESWMGKAFEEQIATNLAQSIMGGGMTEHMAAAILREFDAVMAGSQLRGVDVNNPQFQSMMTSTFTNPSFNPDTFNPDEFLAGFSPAADAAQNMSTAIAETGTSMGGITSEMDVATASADLFAGSMIVANKQAEGVEAHVKAVSADLEKLSKTTTKIPFELEWANPSAFLAWLLPGLIQAVQGAGGVMPGTDSRASSSGPLVRQGQGVS